MMDITFDQIFRKPYYFFDGQFHSIDTYKPYYLMVDNPYIARFVDIPINPARVKSQLVFVITLKGWMIYGHYGDFVYKLAESSYDARFERIVEVIPFVPLASFPPFSPPRERPSQLDIQYEQLVKLKLQITAPLFVTFQEIVQKLSKGLIISYQEEPNLIELSATGNPIMSFAENERNKYLAEVRLENGTIYPV